MAKDQKGLGLKEAPEVTGKREPDLVHRIFLNLEDDKKPLNGLKQKSGTDLAFDSLSDLRGHPWKPHFLK